MVGPDVRTITSGDATIRLRATPWDTRSLGVIAIELIEITGSALDGDSALDHVVAEVDRLCAVEGVGLATTRVPANAAAVIAALERAGYRAVETSHALALAPLTLAPGLDRGLAIEPAQTADAAELAAFARTFEYSRYLEDDRIHPSRGRARMAGWIVDSLTNGDQVVVTRRNDRIAAAMSWQRRGDRVRLLLGGTAADAGPIASMFWAAVVRELARSGVQSIETRVSAANVAALRLHQALGFVTGEPELGLTKIYPGGAAVLATSIDGDALRTR